MPATYAIAEALNTIIMALDPVQRWQYARRFDGSWITEKWFIIVSLLTLTILTSIILITSLYRNLQKNKTANLTVTNLARNKGLSLYEIQILKDIANNSKLKKNEIGVFTTKKVFDDSVKKIIDKQKQQKDPEKIKKLKTELTLLQEKLGFQETEHPNTDAAAPQQLSTRQIPIGKILYITAITPKTNEIESTVTENTETGLTVKLAAHPRINFAEQWRGHYSFEELVYEFDTSVISYDGNSLVLAHSENVRSFNRRRFLRAPVELQALIALFPLNKPTENKNLDNKTDTNATESSQPNNSSALCPPKFINAAVTELGGPSLKIKTDLEAQQGDRILIILNLSEQNISDSSENAKPGEPKQKVVQDIAVVRRIVQTQDGKFLAAEMFGMSDEHIEELVHATNTAPTKELQEKNDNINNTNTNEENQQSNITQDA